MARNVTKVNMAIKFLLVFYRKLIVFYNIIYSTCASLFKQTCQSQI